MTFYRTHGIILDSDIELPELREVADDLAGESVPVRVAAVNSPPSMSTAGVWVVSEGVVHLRVAEVAAIEIRRDSITVEPTDGAALDVLRLYLLGTGLGSLLYLRGFVPMHASTVEAGDGSVCILGDTGAGKSTMLAALVAGGRRMLSDDLTAVRAAADGPVVEPGYPSIKLRRDAAETVGLPLSSARPLAAGLEKYRVDAPMCPEPRPVRRVVFLQAVDTTDHPVAHEQRGVPAVQMLMSEMYRHALGRALGLASEQLRLAVRLVEATGLCVIERPAGGATIPAVARLVEAECAHVESAVTAGSTLPGDGR